MKNKVIRILSFQNAHNYGAVLQAYGLQNSIKTLGYSNVKFIKYNPQYLSERYISYKNKGYGIRKMISIAANVLRTIRRPFLFLSSIKRNKSFNTSIQRMLIQTENLILRESDLHGEECDVLICGSDQIWNTTITGTFDRIFFGYGSYKKDPIKIAYAPSTEISSLNNERLHEIQPLLNNFDFLSVRENSLAKLLQPLTNKPIRVCIDPTILCGKEAYDKIAIKPKHKKYIVVYAYDPNERLIKELIESVPNRHDYSVVLLTLAHTRSITEFFNQNIKANITVEEFLGYFKYADYVVTNSFHGLAFSLLFQRNFNVGYVKNKSARLISLLEQLNLMERYNYDNNNISWHEINYIEIEKHINNIRSQSLNYLKCCLEND